MFNLKKKKKYTYPLCINQSAFQKLKRPFFLFYFTNLPNTRFSVFITVNIFHHNNDTRSRRGCLFKKKEREKSPKLLWGAAPWPVLVWVQSADQALDALQLVGSVLLRASFRRHGNRTGRHVGRVTCHLWCGIQSDSRHGAGRDDAISFQLGPAAGQAGGHGGGEQGAVRCRHGEGVGAVPESGTHCVQEGVPVHRRRRSGGSCRGRCHIRVRIGEQTAKRRHGNALRTKMENNCKTPSWQVVNYSTKIRRKLWCKERKFRSVDFFNQWF